MPQSVLSTTAIDELPISESSRKGLKAAIEYSRVLYAGEEECAETRGVSVTIDPAESLVELVRESSLAIVADVAGREAGWDGDGYGVATAVAFRSVRPLASTAASIPSAFVLLFAGGRIQVGEISLCGPGAAFGSFDVGRRFLILAAASEESTGRLELAAWIPVEGTVLEVDGTSWVRNPVDIDLSALEADLVKGFAP